MFFSFNQQRRGRYVFINCGSLSNRGLLLNRQKRERPVFSRLGARRIGELLLNQQRRERLRVAQQQRIATETSEEIEARRARDRRNHMDLKTAAIPANTCSFQDEAILL